MTTKNPIKVLKDDNGWGLYTQESRHYHLLRGGLSEHHAKQLALQLNELLNCKLTNPDCPYCQGVRGCYNCDS